MDEERKKLEAIGDGLLLAVARLYLRDQPSVPYKIHMRLISRMVNNRTLAEIAEGEGLWGSDGERAADAFEIAVALHYFRHGFHSLRLWLSGLFDKYLDIRAEVERILNPPRMMRLQSQSWNQRDIS
jgi:dsRNA-specific ribonuclease